MSRSDIFFIILLTKIAFGMIFDKIKTQENNN